MQSMELVESQSILKRIFYHYIQEPFLKIRERWLAYFAEFAMDDEPSATDVETEIQRFEELPFKKEHIKPGKSNVRDQSQFTPGRFTFISTALGATFGLGHLWRFPNLAHKYGGGAFLVLYTVFTLLFGYALFFMELSVGQYTSKNALRAFDRVPLMAGVGYSIVAYGYVLSTYYSQVVSFGIYYFASSFDFDLPWTHCPSHESDSNETMCFMVRDPEHPFIMELKCPKRSLQIDIDQLCKDQKYASKVKKDCCEKGSCSSFNINALCRRRQFPSAYHWTTNIIRHHPPNDSRRNYLGEPDLKLLFCSFMAWFLIYVLVSAGIKWTGIISTTIMPFMLIAFLLMIPVAVSVDGALDGITRFFVPNVTDFYQNEIWFSALSHSFFSLGIAMGPGLTLGSVSKFKSPCHTDSLIVCLSVILTSVLTGTIVFSMLGYMSKLTGIVFEYATTKGSGTSIIAYSDILAKFPVSWLSSAIFFFLFTSVAALSVSCVVISTSASIAEATKVKQKDKYVLNFLLVFSSFLLTIPMILREGVIIFSSLDNFTMRLALPLICFSELFSIFIYGLDILCEDIAFMIGYYPSRFFRYSWILCPFAIIGCTVYKFMDLETVDWRKWTKLFEIVVLVILLCPIVLFMFLNFLRYINKPKRIIRSPSSREPRSEELRALRIEFKSRRTII